MARLIDADKLGETLADYQYAISPWFDEDNKKWGAVEDCIAYLDEQPTVGGWISTEDSLPIEGSILLLDQGSIYLVHVIGYGLAVDDHNWVYRLSYYDYWMPIPEPPEGEE